MSESTFESSPSAPDPSPSFSAPDPAPASDGSGAGAWGEPGWGTHGGHPHQGHVGHPPPGYTPHPPPGYTPQHPYGPPGHAQGGGGYADPTGYGPGMYPPGMYPHGMHGHGMHGHGPYAPGYGPPQVPMASPPRYIRPTGQSAGLAALVSFFLPGVGQMMLGQTGKGAIILAVALFTAGFCGLINVLSVIDALAIGGKIQRGQPVKEYEFF